MYLIEVANATIYLLSKVGTRCKRTQRGIMSAFGAFNGMY